MKKLLEALQKIAKNSPRNFAIIIESYKKDPDSCIQEILETMADHNVVLSENERDKVHAIMEKYVGKADVEGDFETGEEGDHTDPVEGDDSTTVKKSASDPTDDEDHSDVDGDDTLMEEEDEDDKDKEDDDDYEESKKRRMKKKKESDDEDDEDEDEKTESKKRRMKKESEDEDDKDEEEDEDDEKTESKKRRKKKESEDHRGIEGEDDIIEDEDELDDEDDALLEEDDDEDEDEKNESTISVVDNAIVKKMIESLGVKDAQAEAFVAVLKTEIARVAESVSSKAVRNIKRTYRKKLENQEAVLNKRVNAYVERASNEFFESHGDVLVDKNRLAMLESLFEKTKNLFADTDFEMKAENSSKIKDLRSELVDKKAYIEELSGKLDKVRKENLLIKIERFVESETEDMTSSDKERFTESVNEIDFNSFEDFRKKATTVKKKFFGESKDDDDMIKRMVEGVDLKSQKMKKEDKGGDVFDAINEILND